MTSQIYRAFRITEAGDIVGPPEVVLRDTDADAIEQANKLTGRNSYGIQLWNLTRLVIRLPPPISPLSGFGGDADDQKLAAACAAPFIRRNGWKFE